MPGASTGYSNYQLDTIANVGGMGPNFVNGVLFSPGGGFPSLTGTAAGTTPQIFTTNSISPINFSTSASTLPSGYGTATTDVVAAVLGSSNGASAGQGGIFYKGDTTLSDNLAGTTGLASVSISIVSASFTNTGANSMTIASAGAIMSVSGSLGSASSSYVAAGLSSSYSLSLNGSTLSTTSLGQIALAATAGFGISSNGGLAGDVGGNSATLTGGKLIASGSTLSPVGSITLLANETITFMATLTLISDPGSTITITSDLAPGFQGGIPSYGIFAGGPSAVPEPSTIILLGVGLASLGCWTQATRRRKSARA